MEIPGTNTTYPRTFALSDRDFLMHHADFVPNMEDVTGTVKIMQFLNISGSVNRSKGFLNRRLRPAILSYLESAAVVEASEITPDIVVGFHYVLAKFVTNQSFSRLYESVPSEYVVRGAITLLRRDSLAQTVNSLNNKLGMLAMYGPQDDDEADFAKSGNFGLGSFKDAQAFGSRQKAFEKGPGFDAMLNMALARKDQDPQTKEEYWLDVYKNIKRGIFAAHYFNSLYPLHHEKRAEVLAYLGVEDTFPYFVIDNEGNLVVTNATGQINGEEAINQVLEPVANSFMHLNSPAVR